MVIWNSIIPHSLTKANDLEVLVKKKNYDVTQSDQIIQILPLKVTTMSLRWSNVTIDTCIKHTHETK